MGVTFGEWKVIVAMFSQWDEITLCLSALLVVYAIVRRVVQHGGVRRSLGEFRTRGVAGDEMILLALVIPQLLQAAYYFLLALHLPFASDSELRAIVIRPSIITSNLILAIYFLNGRLTAQIRRGIDLWKRRFPSLP